MSKIDVLSNPANITNKIGKKSSVSGNLDCKGNLNIEGTINGNIKTNGNVYIMDSAVIHGNITGKHIFISGNVKGNINASGIIKIGPESKLEGDVFTHSFIADSGSFFKGLCKMIPTPINKPVKPNDEKIKNRQLQIDKEAKVNKKTKPQKQSKFKKEDNKVENKKDVEIKKELDTKKITENKNTKSENNENKKFGLTSIIKNRKERRSLKEDFQNNTNGNVLSEIYKDNT